jgi:uncharacterized protein (TIGR02687 family)
MMTNDFASLYPHLEKRFDSQRVVFWHDSEAEYEGNLQDFALGDVELIAVHNDEYVVKHRVLHLEPTQQFLVYRAGIVPPGVGNWLLDLELAYGVFTADRTSLVQQDLGLTAQGIDEVVRTHEKFFRATKRVQSLKALLDPDDDAAKLRAKMCAVLLGQREHSLLELTRTLLVENASGGDTKYRSLVEFGLDDFHWEGVAAIYSYASPSPSVDDFVLWVFQKAISEFASDLPNKMRNIQLDFNSLRDDKRSEKAMRVLAKRAARDLSYGQTLDDRDYRELVDSDLFEEIDQKIITGLAGSVSSRSIPTRDAVEIIRKRQFTTWIEGYRNLYTAIGSGAELLGELENLDVSMKSFADGLDRYRKSWFRIDQLYRQYTFAARKAEHPEPLEALGRLVEGLYLNKYQYVLGAAWQQQVDGVTKWRSSAVSSQMSFFADHVAPIIREGRKKAVVIISDAMRYEVADELGTRIRQEDRFDASLSAMLGVLPSYTQLGMAALLPHTTIGHSGKDDLVQVDGLSATGTANRSKILAAVDGIAMPAEVVLGMSRDEMRELYQQYQVIYIYHNRIDATGDKPATERQVFGAVEETLTELVDLIKRLTNANATNILVTADHGFLFQDSELDESGYLSVREEGDDIAVKARRYIMGTGLKADNAFKTFSSADVGLDSHYEIQIPKSIHRLRLQGSGARFVHGGASLQEIVIPVLTINKTRKSDVRAAHIEILPESDKITTGQLVVKLFQAEPVSDKIQPRTLRAGLFIGDTLISNQSTIVFNQQSEDKRDRYASATMLLSKDANAYNNLSVEFRLEEAIANTTQWRTYATALYTLRRSFATDF